MAPVFMQDDYVHWHRYGSCCCLAKI